jgi:hypothetical protein
MELTEALDNIFFKVTAQTSYFLIPYLEITIGQKFLIGRANKKT